MTDVTELYCIRLSDGTDPYDESTGLGGALAQAIDTVAKQPGMKRIYTGVEIEAPLNLWIFLDWESAEDQLSYHTKENGSISNLLKPHSDASKSLNKNILISPFPLEDVLDKARSPTTEVLLALFPSDYDSESRAVATKRLQQYTGYGPKSSPDWRGISYGWSKESDFPARNGEGSSGTALVSFNGWPSVASHEKFRETADFKDNIKLLNEIPGLVSLSTFHLSCTSRAGEGKLSSHEHEHEDSGHGHGCGSGGCC